MYGILNIQYALSLYMGTLFMRMSSKEHSLVEIKELILKEINSRNPTGLVRKMGDRRGLANVSQGDLVIITHSNGYNGNSGVIAIATATSGCLGPNPSFNPPLSGDTQFGVTITDVIWMPNKMSHDELKSWAYEVDNRSDYLGAPGWAFTEQDLLHVFE